MSGRKVPLGVAPDGVEVTTMRVELLYFDGCPSWTTAERRLRQVADRHGLQVTRRRVDTPEEAEQLRFRGSPTILLDGRDPFAEDEPYGLACRIYQTPDGPAGSPTLDQLEQVVGEHLPESA